MGQILWGTGGPINLPVSLHFCHPAPPLSPPSPTLYAQMNGGNASESVERRWAFA